MKQLTDVKIWIFIFISVLLICFGAFVYFFLTFEIEKSISTILQVDELNTSQFNIDPSDVYLVQKGDKVTLVIDKQYITGYVSSMKLNIETSSMEISISNINVPLTPGMTLPARFIIDHHTLFDQLFSGV